MTRTHRRRTKHGIVAPIHASALLRAALLQAARHGGGQAVRDAARQRRGARWEAAGAAFGGGRPAMSDRQILARNVGACASPAEAVRYLGAVNDASWALDGDPDMPELRAEVRRAAGLCFAAASAATAVEIGSAQTGD